MIFVDASALTAILADEPDAADLVRRIEQAASRITSPIALWETAVAITRQLDVPVADAFSTVNALCTAAKITVVPIPPEATAIALDAFDRYGKARHRAALNMGDCFAYAAAVHAGVPLLFKGNDFSQTDIAAA